MKNYDLAIKNEVYSLIKEFGIKNISSEQKKQIDNSIDLICEIVSQEKIKSFKNGRAAEFDDITYRRNKNG